MNQTQTKQILRLLSGYYPMYFSKLSTKSKEDIAYSWEKAFRNEKYEEVELALIQYVSQSEAGNLPTVGSIKCLIYQRLFEQEIPFDVAWGLVMKAATTDPEKIQKNFHQLPGILQLTLNTPSVLLSIGFSERKDLVFLRKEIQEQYQKQVRGIEEKILTGEVDEIGFQRLIHIPVQTTKPKPIVCSTPQNQIDFDDEGLQELLARFIQRFALNEYAVDETERLLRIASIYGVDQTKEHLFNNEFVDPYTFLDSCVQHLKERRTGSNET